MNDGHGVMIYTNGEKYDGEWKDSKKHGHGVFTRANGSKYYGEWKDSKKNGRGVMIYNNTVLSYIEKRSQHAILMALGLKKRMILFFMIICH